MHIALVTEVKENTASVVFTDLDLQKTAKVVKNLQISAGDTVVVLFEELLNECVVIGVLENG